MKRTAPSRRMLALQALAALAVTGMAIPAHAAPGDGLYGRFDGDLDLSLGLGASLVSDGASSAALGRAFYLETAGAYALYTDALGATRDDKRTLALGISLRPVFLPRWGLDLERGPAFLDLAVDSLTLDLGAFWADHEHTGWTTPGLELGAAFELPLLGQANGLWLGLRASKRWSSPELGGGSAPETRGEMALLTLSWHGVLGTHLVDAGDQAPPRP